MRAVVYAFLAQGSSRVTNSNDSNVNNRPSFLLCCIRNLESTEAVKFLETRQMLFISHANVAMLPFSSAKCKDTLLKVYAPKRAHISGSYAVAAGKLQLAGHHIGRPRLGPVRCGSRAPGALIRPHVRAATGLHHRAGKRRHPG
jgi:hypothetical protein